MELFTEDWVSKAPAQLFPDNTLSSFAIFWPEQLSLEYPGSCNFRNMLPSMYQKVTEESVCFLTGNVHSRLNSIIWNLVFTLPLLILLKP